MSTSPTLFDLLVFEQFVVFHRARFLAVLLAHDDLVVVDTGRLHFEAHHTVERLRVRWVSELVILQHQSHVVVHVVLKIK